MLIKRRNSIVYLRRSIEALRLEEQQLSVLLFGSPHNVKDLRIRLSDPKGILNALLGSPPHQSQQTDVRESSILHLVKKGEKCATNERAARS